MILNQQIIDKVHEAVTAVKELGEIIESGKKGVFVYGDDSCVVGDFEQIANDFYRFAESIMARVYRLGERIDKQQDSE